MLQMPRYLKKKKKEEEGDVDFSGRYLQNT